MSPMIAQAVREHRIMTFSYHELPRTVEPHTYGVDGDGDEILVAYQIGGLTQSGSLPLWRNFKVAGIRQADFTHAVFGSTRPGYNAYDSRLSVIYART